MKIKRYQKIFLFISIFVIIIATSILVVNADTVIGIVTASSLNVRVAADSSSEVLAEIDSGSKVVLLERSNDWYKVNVGVIGYVHAAYIRTEDEVSKGTVSSAAATETALSKGQEVVEAAKKYIGTPYIYGGSTPNGFDCSGFTQYVFRQMGAKIYRVAADQANNGTYVAKEDLKPGDLVFFAKPGCAIHHVGIYVGNGQYIHSPQTGRSVSIDYMTRSDYYTARRIFS
ncbi:MAG: SH3 domain-containing C40 family peptidase [Bacillota bacterium]|nr:SH3 domain-containing C40 family peptidase [Bacillota bacterium]